MKYLWTQTEHYRKFIKENKSPRLSKFLKIYTESKSELIDKLFKKNEIFNSNLITEYSITDQKNVEGKKVIFKTKSDNEYRLDIYFIIEDTGLVNHLSFTKNIDLYDMITNTNDEFNLINKKYNELTENREAIEILNRIKYILSDLVKKDIISNYFCIGGTEIEAKNNIYQYFLKVVVGDGGFIKKKSDSYTKTGWGLYFKI